MSEMSKEDKFFGVTTPLQTSDLSTEDAEIEVEIIDDTPRQPVKADDDDELSSYGEKVRKRINKVRYEQHEAERQRDSAERLREEAVRYAQQVSAENQNMKSLIERGESALVSQIKEKSKISIERARSLYKEAYEQGDPEKIVDAQERLQSAQAEFREAEKHEQVLQNRPKPVQPPQQAPVQAQREVPQPHPKALEWTKRNPWFGPTGNRAMTALAYGIHEKLIREDGVAPDSDEYYEKIDTEMRHRFSDYFEAEGAENAPAPAQRTPSVVVAPSNRNNGARQRKIQLTATQVSLAKRIGLTTEQYARSVLKGEI